MRIDNGRGCSILSEQKLTAQKQFKVFWKKPQLDIARLARLRFDEKLTIKQIAKVLNSRQTTVAMQYASLKVKGQNHVAHRLGSKNHFLLLVRSRWR